MSTEEQEENIFVSLYKRGRKWVKNMFSSEAETSEPKIQRRTPALRPIDEQLISAVQDAATTHSDEQYKKVEQLLKAGANATATDHDGNTPLHNASREDIANILIKAGANVHARNNEGQTPLHRMKDWMGSSLLIHSGADVNAQDNDGRTPLNYLLYNTQYESNDQPDRRDPILRLRPAAAQQNAMLELLLRWYADPDIPDNDGNTALHTAIAKDLTYATTKLLGRDADMTITNNEGNLPLHFVRSEAVLDAILNKNWGNREELNTACNTTNNRGKTPLGESLTRDTDKAVISYFASQDYSKLKAANPKAYEAQRRALKKWVSQNPSERGEILEQYDNAQRNNDALSQNLENASQNNITEDSALQQGKATRSDTGKGMA